MSRAIMPPRLPLYCLHRRRATAVRGSLFRSANGKAALAACTRWPVARRAFATTAARRIMEVSCFSDEQLTVRDAVQRICKNFPDEYWAARDDSGEYPHDFHAAMAKDGWIGIALPEELGGAGLGISEATMMLHTIAESGAGLAGAQSIHANVYATQPVARFATSSQKSCYLPAIVQGRARVCFGVTEPGSGLETLALKTFARKFDDGKGWSVSGQKIWTSSAQVASHMVLLARTEEADAIKARGGKRSEGLSLFLVPLKDAEGRPLPGVEIKPIHKMGARAIDANEVFFDHFRIPEDSLIGKLGGGFKIVLHGMNAERCLLAGEALGLGYAALRKAAKYASEREVFGRKIGQNQGIQHPLADAYMCLEGAKLATYHAARLYDTYRSAEVEGRLDASGTVNGVSASSVGVACNTAKYLAAEAGFKACERAVLALGGMGYAREFHVERYFRECLVPRIAPVSREMVLCFVGEKCLGLPRSY